MRVFVLLAHAICYLPYSGRGGEEERERGGNEAVEAREQEAEDETEVQEYIKSDQDLVILYTIVLLAACRFSQLE